MIPFKKILNIKDAKSKTIIRNVFFSFFIKGINLAISFLTIPLVLTFLNTTQYGIWLTLTAILGWFSLFDLGFGNGLRNHLTISIAKGEYQEGRIYVSTTYAALSAIFGTLIVLFLLIHSFINWTSVFNAPASMEQDLNNAVLFAMCFLFVQFVVRLINTIFLCFQRSALADFTNALVQIFILAGLYLLKLMNFNSLTAVAIVYSLTPIIVFLAVSSFFFLKKYSQIRPSFFLIKIEYVNKLLKLGINFFIIQISALVLYATDNFIITQMFKPADVTVYNIAFKYFGICNVLFTIVLAPFWSMTTRSYAEGDIQWIKKTINKLLLLWLFVSLASLIQLLPANFIYKLWTSGKVMVPYSVSLIMCIYVISTNLGLIFSSFLNGIGKIRIQLIIAVVSMVINIPLAIFFVKYFHTGIVGIPLATILTLVVANLITSIQYKRIINLKASGIWNR